MAGGRSVGGMLTVLSALWSLLCCRLRSRAALELEILALRHQLLVLNRQRSGRPRLSSIDRFLWIWLYRLWPRCLSAMVLVKPATVIPWHRNGFRRLSLLKIPSGASARVSVSVATYEIQL